MCCTEGRKEGEHECTHPCLALSTLVNKSIRASNVRGFRGRERRLPARVGRRCWEAEHDAQNVRGRYLLLLHFRCLHVGDSSWLVRDLSCESHALFELVTSFVPTSKRGWERRESIGCTNVLHSPVIEWKEYNRQHTQKSVGPSWIIGDLGGGRFSLQASNIVLSLGRVVPTSPFLFY